MDNILTILKESVIDFPKTELASDIWDKVDNVYKLKEDVRKKVINFLHQCPILDLLSSELVEDIHITGSIGTNRYTEETDLDVHLVINNSYFKSDEELETTTKAVMDWSRDNGENFINYHPIEVYLQKNKNQEFMSESVYDFVRDKWLVGPDIKPLDYNPYDDYSHIYSSVLKAGGKADKLIGSLNRNVIDYDTVKKAIYDIPKQNRENALNFLLKKIKDINLDIAYLSKFKLYYGDLRKAFSNPEDIKSALKDKKNLKKWNDVNAIFKFLNRYKYLRIVSDLQDLIKDGKLTTKDINKIPKILKEKEIYKSTGSFLKHPKNQYMETYKFTLKNNGLALKYIEEQTPKLCELAVRQNGLALKFVKIQTPELCKLAVSQNGMAYQYSKIKSLEIKKIAVAQNGLSLQFMVRQTHSLCELAVKQNGLAIQYVLNPTTQLKVLAIKQNKKAVDFIENSDLYTPLGDKYKIEDIEIPINHNDNDEKEVDVTHPKPWYSDSHKKKRISDTSWYYDKIDERNR